MAAELSAPARRSLAKLAGSHGVIPVADQLGDELVLAGYASRMGSGYIVTAAGIAAAAVQAPTDLAEGASQALPAAPEPTDPLF